MGVLIMPVKQKRGETVQRAGDIQERQRENIRREKIE